MTFAFVGLGSNLGDRLGNLSLGLQGLAALEGTHIVAVSNAVDSEPWGICDQPPFANAVARVRTELPANRFMELLKDLETALGREPGERNGPRVIDLDILLFGDEEWASPELTIPHPRMAEREFVLTPLLEIAPEVTWPDGTQVDRNLAIRGKVTGVLGPVPGFEDVTPPVGGWSDDAGAEEAGAWEEVASARYSAHGDLSFSVQLMFEAAVLEQEGIPVIWDPVSPQEESTPWPLPITRRLMVPHRHAERARELLVEVRAARPVEEEGDSDPDAG
ncbi:MAG: 2-amino-4-hydroxy-6-hydroxymethyldihydropteridine diphosphokinase [Coriobacteriia bacterium]|nr:2-amino-4-hydroxy-6-hydroxymethyldihydropteridine diphosphokinase [Coriobacteriia bacterium]